MKKDIKSTDKITEGTLHEILLDIKYRLDHLEDIEADNRALIVKLIKQGNSVVKFLSDVDKEVNEIETEKVSFSIKPTDTESKFKDLKELISAFMDKAKDLQELEEELEKHKDQITPGQVGES